jgi:hypothetical protein
MDPSLPPSLDAQDPRSFAHFTLTRRVPRILADVLDASPLEAGPRSRLEAAMARPLELTVRPLPLPADEAPRWERFFAEHEGRRLAEIPFFPWEVYLYAWLLVETRHYETGVDPFAVQKRREFASSSADLEQASRAALEAETQPAARSLRVPLLRSLLANLADASYPEIRGGGIPTAVLHADPWSELEGMLLAGPRVLILADNAMSELFYDLLLAHAIARAAPGVRVELVLKRHPMFVSDATVQDVTTLWDLIDETAGVTDLGRAAAEVRASIGSGRIGVVDWGELNAPWHFTDPGFAPRLQPDATLVLKGDLNFRRALEDRAWSPTCPLERACRAPLSRAILLRVLKSECVAGLPAAAVENANRTDPEWCTNGKHATAQVLRRDGPLPG